MLKNILKKHLIYFSFLVIPLVGFSQEVDSTFNFYGTFNDVTNATAIDSYGRIIVGGNFTKYKTQKAKYLVRIFPDGNIDNSFKLNVVPFSVGEITILEDGKMLITSVYQSTGTTFIKLNQDGTLDNSFSPAFKSIYSVDVLPDTRMLVSGNFTDTLGPGKVLNGLAILKSDGTIDSSFVPYTCGYAYAMQSDGKVVFAIDQNYWIYPGYYYTTVPLVYRMNVDGSMDNTFTANAFSNGWNSSIVQYINDISIQSDDKVLVAGNFSLIQEGTNYHGGNGFARLNANGSFDTTFVGAFYPSEYAGMVTSNSDWIQDMVIEPSAIDSNKIMISYTFNTECCPNTYNNQGYVYRINMNGSFDSSFSIIHLNEGSANFYENNSKIYLTGGFLDCNNTAKTNFAICDSNGVVDEGFYNVAGVSYYGYIKQMKSLSDGKILVAVEGDAGSTNFGNSPADLSRLLPNGNVDTTFHYASDQGVASFDCLNNGQILALYEDGSIKRVNTDGTYDSTFKFTKDTLNLANIKSLTNGGSLVSGTYYTSGYEGTDTTKYPLVGINNDGSINSAFCHTFNKYIDGIVVQDNGKPLLYGSFTTIDSTSIPRLIRLNEDGSIDTSFHVGAGPNGAVSSCVVLYNQKILIAGNFTAYNGKPVHGFSLLNSNGSIDTSFNCVVTKVGWIFQMDSNAIFLTGTVNNIGMLLRIDTTGKLLDSSSSILPIAGTFAAHDSNRFFVYTYNGDYLTSDSTITGGVMRFHFGKGSYPLPVDSSTVTSIIPTTNDKSFIIYPYVTLPENRTAIKATKV